MNTDPNTIAVLFVLVIAPVAIALSIPVLSWLEGRNTQKQREIDEVAELQQSIFTVNVMLLCFY